MKSLEERYEELVENPKKVKRFFSFAWIVSYTMLIIGFVIILWVLIQGR